MDTNVYYGLMFDDFEGSYYDMEEMFEPIREYCEGLNLDAGYTMNNDTGDCYKLVVGVCIDNLSKEEFIEKVKTVDEILTLEILSGKLFKIVESSPSSTKPSFHACVFGC